MANKEKQAENKEKFGIGAWLALIVLILVLSGAFRTAEGPIKVLDFTNLAGSFGQIGDTGANLIGKGGTGAKDGFMAGFNLIPAVMFFCGLLGVFEQLGAFKASDILFRPQLAPKVQHRLSVFVDVLADLRVNLLHFRIPPLLKARCTGA